MIYKHLKEKLWNSHRGLENHHFAAVLPALPSDPLNHHSLSLHIFLRLKFSLKHMPYLQLVIFHYCFCLRVWQSLEDLDSSCLTHYRKIRLCTVPVSGEEKDWSSCLWVWGLRPKECTASLEIVQIAFSTLGYRFKAFFTLHPTAFSLVLLSISIYIFIVTPWKYNRGS